jgi:hypothetical protein
MKNTKITNKKIYEFDNGWLYEFSSLILFDKKQPIKKYNHVLYDENKNQYKINSISGRTLQKILPLVIYEKIGYVYKTNNWKYSIKINKFSSIINEMKLSHYIEINGIVLDVPYFPNRLITEKILEKWEKYHFLPPSVTGNKRLCESMFLTLDNFAKKIGKSKQKILSDDDMKEIKILLTLKKLTD